VIAGIQGVLDEVVDRLLRVPESRLVATGPDGRTTAGVGHELAQRLADAAACVEHRGEQTPPAARALPWLGPFVVAHQLAVTGTDLIAAAGGLDVGVTVWADGGRAELASVLAGCAADLRRFRKLL
jgi:hypothetical protein